MSSQDTAKIGDIVLLKQGIGVIRYHGQVDFDEDHIYYGVELKGPPTPGGHNGTINGKEYFTTTGGDGRGIFVRQPLRIIQSEEILEKLAEIYDILKGRKGHSHFIARATYDDLRDEHELLKDELEDKLSQLDELSTDNAILKEQISMMKGSLGDKIDETAHMSDKITRAEKKLGSRLSQIDLSHVKHQLEAEQDGSTQADYTIPDYAATGNEQKKHRKQRSSTTIELDKLHDDFGEIAKNVQAFGQKDAVSGPMHYRKFSNTTRQIMDQHRNAGTNMPEYENMNGNMDTAKQGGHRARGSVQIADIVDENGIDYDSAEEEPQNLARDSDDEDAPKRKVKSRASRESRQLDENQIDHDYVNDEAAVRERESEEEEEDEDQSPKRKVKSRASRRSRQLDDVEVTYGDPEDDSPPKRVAKSRASRQSRQLDEEPIDVANEEENESEEFGDAAAQIDHSVATRKAEKHKARDSYQIPAPELSEAVLETHNEHNLEQEAGQINGPRDGKRHNKNLSMTSDSSAYRAFMSVD